MATSCERNAVKVKWYNVKIRTILTNCLGFLAISPFLFSHKKWFRRAISCASFPPGEAILRRMAALGGQRPPPLEKPINTNLSAQRMFFDIIPAPGWRSHRLSIPAQPPVPAPPRSSFPPDGAPDIPHAFPGQPSCGEPDDIFPRRQ